MQNQSQNFNQDSDQEQNKNQEQPLKKEHFLFMTLKTHVIVLIFTVFIAIIIGGGVLIMKHYNSEANNRIVKPVNQTTENYYDVLEKKCAGDSCCLASLKTMRANNYKEADKNGKCPEGFYMDMLKCVTSYQWCVPMKESCAKAGELINYPSGTNKNLPDVCCDGLKGLAGFGINENGECERLKGGPFLTCMSCGNGICESINNFNENKCNCPEDCGEKSDTSNWQIYRNEEFEVKYPTNWIVESNIFYSPETYNAREGGLYTLFITINPSFNSTDEFLESQGECIQNITNFIVNDQKITKYINICGYRNSMKTIRVVEKQTVVGTSYSISDESEIINQILSTFKFID